MSSPSHCRAGKGRSSLGMLERLKEILNLPYFERGEIMFLMCICCSIEAENAVANPLLPRRALQTTEKIASDLIVLRRLLQYAIVYLTLYL
jgi:hypothetical protein